MKNIHYIAITVICSVIGGLQASENTGRAGTIAHLKAALQTRRKSVDAVSSGTRPTQATRKPSANLATLVEGSETTMPTAAAHASSVVSASKTSVRRHSEMGAKNSAALAALRASMAAGTNGGAQSSLSTVVIAMATSAVQSSDDSGPADLTTFDGRAKMLKQLQKQWERQAVLAPTADELAAAEHKTAIAAAESHKDVERLMSTFGTLTKLSSFTECFDVLFTNAPNLPCKSVLETIKGLEQAYFGYTDKTLPTEKEAAMERRGAQSTTAEADAFFASMKKLKDYFQTKTKKSSEAKKIVKALQESGFWKLYGKTAKPAPHNVVGLDALKKVQTPFDQYLAATTAAAAGGTGTE